jgi:glycosyltransferase involved in cell wall biosynthesis
MPFISITIPAYKNVSALARLLDSIAIQTFTDYEVIITDDTPDTSVQDLVSSYQNIHRLIYVKNKEQLGTPENWNEGISIATGEWIKIMHHDDWFKTPDALQLFAKAATGDVDFIYAAYQNIFLETGKIEPVVVSYLNRKRFNKDPWVLFASNYIGPPSVTMIRRPIHQMYDKELKWRVDTEFYIRLLQQKARLKFLPVQLINVGMHPGQVTGYTFLKPEVELPEGLHLLQKHGTESLHNIWVYDAWWRLFRNLAIKEYSTVLNFTEDGWPVVCKKMISYQKNLPDKVLKNGICSKFFMSVSYLRHRLFTYA